MKTIGNHTHYRDVYVFIERLKDLQAIKGEELVRNSIHASLRGTALDWYTVELTEFKRRSLRHMPLSKGWYSMLVARFKLRASQALNKIFHLSYGPEEYNQLTQAWTKLHPNLRRDIPEPTEDTKIIEFLAAHEDIWRDIANASPRRGNYQNQNRQFSNYLMRGRGYGDPLTVREI
ncbi:hypothetical protein V8E54_006367 [Elaphomyces granulatus]